MKVLDFLEEKGYEVVFIGLRGSSHFGLKVEGSDEDYSAIVVPKVKDLFYKEEKFLAKEYKIDELTSVQVMSLQGLLQSLKKVTLNLVEYFSLPVYIDEDFKKFYSLVKSFLLESEEAEQLFQKTLFFTYGYKIVAKELSSKELAKFYFYDKLIEKGKTIKIFFEDLVDEELVEEYKRIKKEQEYSLEHPRHYYQEKYLLLKDDFLKIPSTIEVPDFIVDELTKLIFHYLYESDPKFFLKG